MEKRLIRRWEEKQNRIIVQKQRKQSLPGRMVSRVLMLHKIGTDKNYI